ncbi:hypothetical protein CEUSTIGMA_g11827.t1 [Chlamydomonas eustigma]|uniref:Uncharacterized protein n=1 Tax=Chlamydomonas eustigma TaxID=1157962 RepID=A0A250XMS5_9CHLO|nr:hypothetical protein CEUSTIGMA_g11827.t1 [Chlamydomonas eustigma]|eukprot:GAX84405.1 hypothetical protein CEUSTIGMA_g11827.t1 [Chlamydomonas eustigma]
MPQLHLGASMNSFALTIAMALSMFLLPGILAQKKYTVSTLPGNWWNVNDDLNEQWQAVQALLRSGLEAGNELTYMIKPTQWAWAYCYLTDCSTRVQVPSPYCTIDCIATGLCNNHSTDPSGMYYSACCQLDPLAQVWINTANEAGRTLEFCPEYRQQHVDRFVSYCDFHTPYTDENGTDPSKSFFNCQSKSVARYYANHTYFDNWILDKHGVVYQADNTTNNVITSLSLHFYDDIYIPAGGNATAPPPSSPSTTWSTTDHWSTGYENVTNFATEPGPYNRAWRFSMVPELLCLPLEELITEDIVWQPVFDVEYNKPSYSRLAEAIADVPNCTLTGYNRSSSSSCKSIWGSYWSYYSFEQYQPYFWTYTQENLKWAIAKGSLNGDIAVREYLNQYCSFYPLMEHHASRWSSFATTAPSTSHPGLAAMSADYAIAANAGYNFPQSLDPILDKTPQYMPKRQFLPDTIRRIS